MVPNYETHLEAYTEFCRIRGLHQAMPDLPILDYSRFKFPGAFSNLMQFMYAAHSEGFAREILNEIHNLRRYLTDLQCWLVVLKSLTEEEKRRDVIIEFLDDRTVLALGRSTAIKSRFIYAATKLGLVYAKLADANDLPREHEIDVTEMKNWIGTWPGYPRFIVDLNDLDGTDFRRSISNFRNLDAHRFPPRVEYGLTPARGIFLNEGRISYSVDYNQPVKLPDVGPLLAAEYSRMVKTVDSFWAMIPRLSAGAA